MRRRSQCLKPLNINMFKHLNTSKYTTHTLVCWCTLQSIIISKRSYIVYSLWVKVEEWRSHEKVHTIWSFTQCFTRHLPFSHQPHVTRAGHIELASCFVNGRCFVLAVIGHRVSLLTSFQTLSSWWLSYKCRKRLLACSVTFCTKSSYWSKKWMSDGITE